MNYLIFGGGGFIGGHLTKYISEQNVSLDNIYNLDICNSKNTYVKHTYVDVRKPIVLNIENASSSIIFNLAAIHVTPGHEENSYFETNVLGAENVCNFARQHNINTIVFTSSIAPYGVSEDLKSESTLPIPKTPYGISKLTAEYVHKLWQNEQPDIRRLIIVRPGVVFGRGEGENFTRLYTALKKGFFFYPGRKDTIKAAVYVKDAVRILYETAIFEIPGITMFNLTYFPAPTIEEICQVISKVTKVKKPKLVVPHHALKLFATLLYTSAKFFGVKMNGIHPDRVKKLTISTNISAKKLSETRYSIKYDLEESIVDWFNDCHEEGLY